MHFLYGTYYLFRGTRYKIHGVLEKSCSGHDTKFRPLLRGGVDSTLDCRAGGHGIESYTVLG